MARRVCYERLGGFRPELPHTQDNEMWMRLLLFYDVACVGKPLVTWRQHSTSASSEWGLDIAWLEEHFLTTRILFKSYPDRIPDCENLKRQVNEKFVAQALSRGIRAFGNENFDLADQYLMWARKIERNLIARKDYWRLELRIRLGSQGYNLCRNMSKRIKELI